MRVQPVYSFAQQLLHNARAIPKLIRERESLAINLSRGETSRNIARGKIEKARGASEKQRQPRRKEEARMSRRRREELCRRRGVGVQRESANQYFCHCQPGGATRLSLSPPTTDRRRWWCIGETECV